MEKSFLFPKRKREFCGGKSLLKCTCSQFCTGVNHMILGYWVCYLHLLLWQNPDSPEILYFPRSAYELLGVLVLLPSQSWKALGCCKSPLKYYSVMLCFPAAALWVFAMVFTSSKVVSQLFFKNLSLSDFWVLMWSHFLLPDFALLVHWLSCRILMAHSSVCVLQGISWHLTNMNLRLTVPLQPRCMGQKYLN